MKGDFMPKSLAGLLLVFIFAAAFVNFHPLGRYYLDEPYERGTFGQAYVTVQNPTGSEIEDVSVKLIIYDLGVQYTSIPFDVPKRDSRLSMIHMPISRSFPPGTYLSKLTVSNDEFRDSKHIEIRIV
tara:strand:- start:1219 stop:1599 length:381 start_codon:yes stop_codon:yes gene_type:complete